MVKFIIEDEGRVGFTAAWNYHLPPLARKGQDAAV